MSRRLLRMCGLPCSRQIIYQRRFPKQLVQHCSSIAAQKCWSCGANVGGAEYFCGCEKNVVLPVDPKRDYFSALGCKRSFNLDTGELRKTFRHLQTRLHPDKFSNEPQEAQEHSAEQSSFVNNAYQTLFSPLQRGLYLLELHGMAVTEGVTSMDQVFLGHVMDLNDSLDDIETEDDLKEFMPDVKELIDTCTQKASDAFDQGDYEVARDQICQLKYFVNLQQRAKDKLLAVDIAS